MRRHWIAALIPVILLVGVAAMLGLRRTPQYTADAQISVGPVYFVNPAGISSVLQGTESLASVYARAISASTVQQDTARRLGHPRSSSDQLSATPIPDSPLIKVSAMADSAREATALANAGSAALAQFADRQVRLNEEATSLSRLYERASLRYRHLKDASDRLTRRYDANRTHANRLARDRAAAKTDAALLERNAILANYQNVAPGAGSKPTVSVFSAATSASSDRYTVLQILIVAGVVGGLLAGMALALALAHRDAPT